MDEIEVKSSVRERDGFRCVDCGMTNDQHLERFGRRLDVHRLEAGSKYAVDGCVTLCRPCHTKKPKQRGRAHLVFGDRVGLFAKVLPDCLEMLEEASVRLGISRAAVIEILARSAVQIQPQSVTLVSPADHRGKRGQGRRKK